MEAVVSVAVAAVSAAATETVVPMVEVAGWTVVAVMAAAVAERPGAEVARVARSFGRDFVPPCPRGVVARCPCHPLSPLSLPVACRCLLMAAVFPWFDGCCGGAQ